MRTIEQLTKKKMLPLRPPTDDQALHGQLKAAKAQIEELLKGDLSKYEKEANELLENYSALDLVAAFLKNLSKDSSEVKVKITPEKPLPYKGNGRKNHGRGRGKGRGHDRNRRGNFNKRNQKGRTRRGHGNGHEFVIKNKKG